MLCCCRLPLRSANDKDTHLKKAGFASLRGSMLPHIVVTKVSLGVLRHFASRMIRGRVTLILLDVKVVLELYITVCLGVCLLVDFLRVGSHKSLRNTIVMTTKVICTFRCAQFTCAYDIVINFSFVHIQVADSDNSDEFLAIAGRKLNLQLRCCRRCVDPYTA